MTHGPVTSDHVDALNRLAKHIDTIFNGGSDKNTPRNVGFALLTYAFGENLKGTGRVNYIGNGKREDVLIALKELVARWEGRHPEEGGTPVPRQ